MKLHFSTDVYWPCIILSCVYVNEISWKWILTTDLKDRNITRKACGGLREKERDLAADPCSWKRKDLQLKFCVICSHVDMTLRIPGWPTDGHADHHGRENRVVVTFVSQIREPGSPTGINCSAVAGLVGPRRCTRRQKTTCYLENCLLVTPPSHQKTSTRSGVFTV